MLCTTLSHIVNEVIKINAGEGTLNIEKKDACGFLRVHGVVEFDSNIIERVCGFRPVWHPKCVLRRSWYSSVNCISLMVI